MDVSKTKAKCPKLELHNAPAACLDIYQPASKKNVL